MRELREAIGAGQLQATAARLLDGRAVRRADSG
jgi:hypothetical protein